MSIISFVILHYGNVQVTKTCIDSILQLNTNDTIQIVIVDNDVNKTKEERQVLKEMFAAAPQVDVLQIEEKSGFSRANNRGYQYTKGKHNPDFIVMANNDIVFEQKGFIDDIKRSYEESKYAILSPDIVSCATGLHQSPIALTGRTKGEVNYTIAMNWMCLKTFPMVYPLIKGKFRNENVGNAEVPSYQEDVVPCGACIIFSRNFIDCEEYALYPETEFYYEEYILHHRCQRANYKIVLDPALQVMHGDGVATKKSTGDEKRKAKFIMENTLRSVKIYKDLLNSEKKTRRQ